MTFAMLLALAVRCLLYSYDLNTDSKRYVTQAHEILGGQGFRFGSELTTLRPPGYPILLAAVFAIFDDPHAAVLVNMALSIASCYLVYAAIRPSSNILSRLALFAMAVHPLIAYRVGTLMTETEGVFLTSLLVFLISKFETGTEPPIWLSFVTGVLCIALVLTVPPMIFLAAGVWSALAWRGRRNVIRSAGLIVGALLLFIPWQFHCLQAVGHIEPLIYGHNTNVTIAGPESGVVNASSGFCLWVQTWLKRDADRGIYWWEERFDKIPDNVFDSADEKALLREQYHAGFAGTANPMEYDRAFGDAAARRAAKHPIYCRFIVPGIRAACLYVDMPQIDHAQMDFIPRVFGQYFVSDYKSIGIVGAVVRELKSIWSLVVYLAFVSYPILFIVCAIATWRDARLIPAAIIVGTFAYTVVSTIGPSAPSVTLCRSYRLGFTCCITSRRRITTG